MNNKNYPKHTKDKCKLIINKNRVWCIKITIVTMLLAGLFSFVSNLTASVSSIVATIFLLLFLIVLSIIFDGIAVAVTSCDKVNFIKYFGEDNNKYLDIATKLIDNQEIVANISADVIGDIFSIISGTCSVSIVINLLHMYPSINEQLLTIMLSSLVAGITVGGKAMLKRTAIKNCNSYLLFTSKVIAIFCRRKNVFRKNTKS